LVPGELRDDAATIWDVTHHWRELGPSTILRARAVWDWGEPRDGQAPVGSWSSDLCLVAVVLTSNDDRAAVITLGERGPNGECRASADNLVVFFSLAEARAAGLPTTGGL
jgi:hypothetical protein